MTEPQDMDAALAELLLDLRRKRGLSIKRLAKSAGVARRTIDNAEKGLNISVVVLKKLLAALGVDEVTIRVSGPHSAHISDSPPSSLLSSVAEEIRRGSDIVSNAAVRLHELTRRDQPKRKLDEQAESLINNFTAYVRSVNDPDQLSNLEQSVSNLYTPDAKQALGAARRRKRKLA